MSRLTLLALILSFIIVPAVRAGLFDIDEEVDDPDMIEAKSYKYYLGKHTNEITAKCAVNEMTSYALEGDATDLGEMNEICPNLPSGNCCGKEDQARIKAFWKHDTRHQGYYHAAYLKMNRYVLGYTRQYAEIANQILSKADEWIRDGKIKNKKVPQDMQDDDDDQPYHLSYHPMCVESANEFIHQDFVDRIKAQIYYKELNRKMQFLQNARRGFYCMLCDANARDYLLTRRFVPLRASIKYSRDFCEMTHDWLYTSVYMLHKAYNPFLKHLFRMLACVTPRAEGNNVFGRGNSTQAQNGADVGLNVNVNVDMAINALSMRLKLTTKDPIKVLPDKLRKLYENPLQLRKRFWLEACYGADPKGFWFPIQCYNFCDNFKMVKASALFDGDVDAMELVYHELEQYEFALRMQSENIFNDDIMQLKDHIERSLGALGRNYLFYRALNPEIDFSKFTNDFSIFYRGINPMAIAEGTNLQFAYTSASILKAIVTLLTIMLF